MFRDETKVEVHAGRGGDGLVALRHEKYVAKGGPWGGDGGDGGSVVFVTQPSINSLLHIGRQMHYRAGNGRPGGPAKMRGRNGKDLIVEVPVGTQVYDAERGNLLRDLDQPEQSLVIARGGDGGRGNANFANSVRQTPRYAEPGRDGEVRRLRLELKIVADVGLVGLPNAGKSTFLSAVSAARPKVADYPFTTLVPQVGIAPVGDYDTLCLADLPGLIEGAAEGIGLGHRFLRHVERCRVLLFLLDVSAAADCDPFEAFKTLDRELELYSKELAARPRLCVASKCEGDEAEARAAQLEAEVDAPLLRISSVQGTGLTELLRAAHKSVRALDAAK